MTTLQNVYYNVEKEEVEDYEPKNDTLLIPIPITKDESELIKDAYDSVYASGISLEEYVLLTENIDEGIPLSTGTGIKDILYALVWYWDDEETLAIYIAPILNNFSRVYIKKNKEIALNQYVRRMLVLLHNRSLHNVDYYIKAYKGVLILYDKLKIMNGTDYIAFNEIYKAVFYEEFNVKTIEEFIAEAIRIRNNPNGNAKNNAASKGNAGNAKNPVKSNGIPNGIPNGNDEDEEASNVGSDTDEFDNSSDEEENNWFGKTPKHDNNLGPLPQEKKGGSKSRSKKKSS